LTITASIGVAANTGQETSLRALQHQADEAVRQAKKSGRNRVSTLQVLA
jgi:diguanylate cyclase (GGDEF)-like protein